MLDAIDIIRENDIIMDIRRAAKVLDLFPLPTDIQRYIKKFIIKEQYFSKYLDFCIYFPTVTMRPDGYEFAEGWKKRIAYNQIVPSYFAEVAYIGPTLKYAMSNDYMRGKGDRYTHLDGGLNTYLDQIDNGDCEIKTLLPTNEKCAFTYRDLFDFVRKVDCLDENIQLWRYKGIYFAVGDGQNHRRYKDYVRDIRVYFDYIFEDRDDNIPSNWL